MREREEKLFFLPLLVWLVAAPGGREVKSLAGRSRKPAPRRIFFRSEKCPPGVSRPTRSSAWLPLLVLALADAGGFGARGFSAHASPAFMALPANPLICISGIAHIRVDPCIMASPLHTSGPGLAARRSRRSSRARRGFFTSVRGVKLRARFQWWAVLGGGNPCRYLLPVRQPGTVCHPLLAGRLAGSRPVE